VDETSGRAKRWIIAASLVAPARRGEGCKTAVAAH
jgi:hypothetical protein